MCESAPPPIARRLPTATPSLICITDFCVCDSPEMICLCSLSRPANYSFAVVASAHTTTLDSHTDFFLTLQNIAFFFSVITLLPAYISSFFVVVGRDEFDHSSTTAPQIPNKIVRSRSAANSVFGKVRFFYPRCLAARVYFVIVAPFMLHWPP